MYLASKGVPTGSSKLFDFIDPSAYNENWIRRCNSKESVKPHSADSNSINSLTSARLVDSARWVILSNTIVAYWPFSVVDTSSSEHQEKEKCLNFSYPTCGLFITCIYIILNVAYIIYFSLYTSHQTQVGVFDWILWSAWNLLVIVGATLHRFYGLMRLSKFCTFWNKILNVIDQCSLLNGEGVFEMDLNQVKRCTLKWLVIFSVLGLAGCTFFSISMFENSEFGPSVLPFLYLQAVVYMHNSSSLMLIYFINIMTIGFSTCKDKLNQLALALQPTGNSCQNKRDLFSLATTMPLLDGIFNLVDELEDTVSKFNRLFGFSLFLEAVFGYSLILFAMYFLHESPHTRIFYILGLMMPILIYSTCLITLCVVASKMSVECEEMIHSFQRLSLSSISQDDSYKIQLLVTRIVAMPPVIKIGQLFQIRESLLVSILNALATYFIVLVQMKQLNKSTIENNKVHTVAPAEEAIQSS